MELNEWPNSRKLKKRFGSKGSSLMLQKDKPAMTFREFIEEASGEPGSPKLTPHQAMQKFKSNGGKNFHHGEHKYILDGPQGSPGELHAPFAYHGSGKYVHYVQGEVGDPITRRSKWGKADF